MLEDEVLIISNNPMVQNINGVEIVTVSGGVKEVFYQALNLACQGHRLLSHPLAGSVKPNESPYKSMVFTRLTSQVDMESLKILEKCLQKVEAMMEDKFKIDRGALYLEDFQLVDKDLINNALHSLFER